jgi:hypothetical protein
VSAAVSPAAANGRHDHAARRKSQRNGRERGCWVYIPAELLAKGDPTDGAYSPWYRVYGGARGRFVVTLYDRG